MKASKLDKDQQLMWESYAKTQQPVNEKVGTGKAIVQKFIGGAQKGGKVRAGETLATTAGKTVRAVGDKFEVLIKGGGKRVFNSAEDAAKWAGANPGQVLKYTAGGAAIYGGYKTLDAARQAMLGMTPDEKAKFIADNPELAAQVNQTGILGILKDPDTGAYSPGRIAAAGAAGDQGCKLHPRLARRRRRGQLRR